MLDRFINAMNWMGDPSSFEAYWLRLQRNGALGGPSAEEARRDYQAVERYKSLTF